MNPLKQIISVELNELVDKVFDAGEACGAFKEQTAELFEDALVDLLVSVRLVKKGFEIK